MTVAKRTYFIEVKYPDMPWEIYDQTEVWPWALLQHERAISAHERKGAQVRMRRATEK